MIGYCNARNLNGQFLPASDTDDELVGRLEHPDQIVYPEVDNELPEGEVDEEFDEQLEETFWSSPMLGSDYDREDDGNIGAWIASRYADVIRLNDAVGFKPINVAVDEPVTEAIVAVNDNECDTVYDLMPSFLGCGQQPIHWSHKRSLRENRDYSKLRGKAHAK